MAAIASSPLRPASHLVRLVRVKIRRWRDDGGAIQLTQSSHVPDDRTVVCTDALAALGTIVRRLAQIEPARLAPRRVTIAPGPWRVRPVPLDPAGQPRVHAP